MVEAASYIDVDGQTFVVLIMEKASSSLRECCPGEGKEPLPSGTIEQIAWALASTLATLHDKKLLEGDNHRVIQLCLQLLIDIFFDQLSANAEKLEDWYGACRWIQGY